MQAGGESVCKDILKELKVPEGGKDMYEHLKDHKIRITNSKKMFPYQKKALLPDSEDRHNKIRYCLIYSYHRNIGRS